MHNEPTDQPGLKQQPMKDEEQNVIADLAIITTNIGSAQEGKEEGAFIFVGDNDTVSSLDTSDCFADEFTSKNNNDTGEDRNPPARRLRGRRRPQSESKLDQNGTRTTPSSNNVQRPNLNLETKSLHRRSTRKGRLSPTKDGALARSPPKPLRNFSSPNLPQRQKTGEPTKRSPRDLQRIRSDPDMHSPTSMTREKIDVVPDVLGPWDPLEFGGDSGSEHSLDSLQHQADDEDDDALKNANSGHSGGNSSATNSRWSASTGHRSMNTAQLDQLSIVPRVPQRQKTGENIQQVSERIQMAKSLDSHDSVPKETSKKRPQLPNRQKSFGRNTLTLDQAAKAALAMVEGSNGSPALQQQQQQRHAPSKPQRTKSNDGSFSRQKSLPNLNNPRQSTSPASHEVLSLSLHASNNETPRLPERKASSRRHERPRSPYSMGKQHSARRFAKNEGNEADNDAPPRDVDANKSNNNTSGKLKGGFSDSWANLSGESFFVEDDDDLPKMPWRQISTDELALPDSLPETDMDNDPCHNMCPLHLQASVNVSGNHAPDMSRVPYASDPQIPEQQVLHKDGILSLEGALATSLQSMTSKLEKSRLPAANEISVADLSMSLHSKASLTMGGANNMPGRQIHRESEVKVGRQGEVMGTVTSASDDMEQGNNRNDSNHHKATDDEEDGGIFGDDEIAEETAEGEDSMSGLPMLPFRPLPSTEFPPPQSLNFVNHNISMSTLDESNSSRLHRSGGAGNHKQKLLSVTRTCSTSTAPTTTSTLSGHGLTPSVDPGAFSTIDIQTRQVSNSQRRQPLQGGNNAT